MNELRPFDPFSVEPLEDTLRSLMRPWRADALAAAPRIKIDLTEQDSSFTVKAEIPGVRKEDIDVRVDSNVVTISAESRKESEQKDGSRVLRREMEQGYASRSLTLSCPVDEGRAEARYENGVLELKLPKKAGSTSKRLAVH
jgi:HSP20 family protein